MRKLKQQINKDIVKAVTEYHEWHGDKNICVIRFVCNSIGEPLIWTRVMDEHGRHVTCLLDFDFHHEDGNLIWDIIEVYHSSREDEDNLISGYENGNNQTDDV